MKRELYIYPHLISIYIYMDMDIILYTIVFYEEIMYLFNIFYLYRICTVVPCVPHLVLEIQVEEDKEMVWASFKDFVFLREAT